MTLGARFLYPQIGAAQEAVSASGQKQTSAHALVMSAIPLGGKNRQTLTLRHISGLWEDMLKQLAAGRKIEGVK